MANTLLTIDMITRESIRLWRNSNCFIKQIDHQYDDQFAKSGAKIGDTLRIRLPNQYLVRHGAAASVQDTAEQSTTLVVASQSGVDVSFNSVDRALKLEDYSRRILAPMVSYLAADVAQDVMSGVEGGISNFVSNKDAAGNIITPTAGTFLSAGAKLTNNGAPIVNQWFTVLDPNTMADFVPTLMGLLNPQVKISEQYTKGIMTKDSLRFDWCEDPTVLKHTTATYTVVGGTNTAATVSGAGQSGSAITTSAITGGLAKGDIITFEGVEAVNRLTRQTTGERQQFVVTTAVVTGGTSIPIYPALVPPIGGNQVQYQTVTASPANGADVDVVTLPGEVYRKNIAASPDAVTMATADLELPGGVQEASRKSFDGISMRIVTAYNIQTDETITRLDILYGYKWIKPEWAVAVGNALVV